VRNDDDEGSYDEGSRGVVDASAKARSQQTGGDKDNAVQPIIGMRFV
jgi:hypothetical protein